MTDYSAQVYDAGYPERVAALLMLLALGIAVGLWRIGSARGTARRPAARARVFAPDDDDDFLRELDRRTRRSDDEPLT